MISYIMVGTNNFDKAVEFYDTLMSEMGAEKAYATELERMMRMHRPGNVFPTWHRCWNVMTSICMIFSI